MSGAEGQLSILIAEDEATLAAALAEFLRQKGHQVDLARDGEEALALLEERSYPLVITDLVMPGADGLKVLRRARQRDPASLVVIMTGYASLDSAIGAIREGAYDYLCKPFKLQEIEIAVTNAARLIQLHYENQRLLVKLNDLTAKIQEMQQLSQHPALVDHSGKHRPLWSTSPVPLGDFFPEKPGSQDLADLERLRDLYKENLLTRDEYQKLKQRLLI